MERLHRLPQPFIRVCRLVLGDVRFIRRSLSGYGENVRTSENGKQAKKSKKVKETSGARREINRAAGTRGGSLARVRALPQHPPSMSPPRRL